LACVVPRSAPRLRYAIEAVNGPLGPQGVQQLVGLTADIERLVTSLGLV
jgi:hypothetical protein